MAPLTIGTTAMMPTRMYSSSSLGPPGTNSALLNTAWMSSGLTMPIVEVSTMRPTTAATRPRYGRNSGITRRAVSRPIRPLSHPEGRGPALEYLPDRSAAGLPAGPPLRDLPVRDPEDHDGGELDRLAGRRPSEHGTGVRAVQGPPDRDPVSFRDQVVDGEAQVGVGAVHRGDDVFGTVGAGRLPGQGIVVDPVRGHQVAQAGRVAGRDHLFEHGTDQGFVRVQAHRVSFRHRRAAAAAGANSRAWSVAKQAKSRGALPVSASTSGLTCAAAPCRSRANIAMICSATKPGIPSPIMAW